MGLGVIRTLYCQYNGIVLPIQLDCTVRTVDLYAEIQYNSILTN